MFAYRIRRRAALLAAFSLGVAGLAACAMEDLESQPFVYDRAYTGPGLYEDEPGVFDEEVGPGFDEGIGPGFDGLYDDDIGPGFGGLYEDEFGAGFPNGVYPNDDL